MSPEPANPRRGASHLHASWAGGQPTFGLWVAIPASIIPEMAAAAGGSSRL